MSGCQLAKNVLDHHDGAVHDDPEINGADREQIGRNVTPIEADERKQQRKRNRHRDDERGADAEEEQAEHDEDEQHAAQQIALDGLRGFLNQLSAVVVRNDLDVGRQHTPVQDFRQFLHFFENDLRLFANTHQNHAFDGIVLVHVPELAEPRGSARRDRADVLDENRNAVVACDDDVPDVIERFHQAQTADVVELSALREEPAAGVGVVARKLVHDLRHTHRSGGEPVRIDLHLILERLTSQP